MHRNGAVQKFLSKEQISQQQFHDDILNVPLSAAVHIYRQWTRLRIQEV